MGYRCKIVTPEDTFIVLAPGDPTCKKHDYHYESSEVTGNLPWSTFTLFVIWECKHCGKKLEQMKKFKAPRPEKTPIFEVEKK